jgi:hypothetical protein
MCRGGDGGARTLLRRVGEDCAASSLFPAHQNDEPYCHRDGHYEYAHSKSLRNLCDVDAAHGRSLVERRQPHQARERLLSGACRPGAHRLCRLLSLGVCSPGLTRVRGWARLATLDRPRNLCGSVYGWLPVGRRILRSGGGLQSLKDGVCPGARLAGGGQVSFDKRGNGCAFGEQHPLVRDEVGVFRPGCFG